jgi:hypothetical protein
MTRGRLTEGLPPEFPGSTDSGVNGRGVLLSSFGLELVEGSILAGESLRADPGEMGGEVEILMRGLGIGQQLGWPKGQLTSSTRRVRDQPEADRSELQDSRRAHTAADTRSLAPALHIARV